MFYVVNPRFGWDVGEGSRSDSAGGQPGPEEVAERPSQAPNGSAAFLRKFSSRDERARSGTEGAWSSGEKGRPKAREVKRRARWSRLPQTRMRTLFLRLEICSGFSCWVCESG
jgi:hypothetical protein